jgi:hypothetical protein
MYDPAHDRAETGDLGGARPGRGLRYGGGITAAAMSGTEANGRPGLAVDCGYLSTISWRSEETPAFYAPPFSPRPQGKEREPTRVACFALTSPSIHLHVVVHAEWVSLCADSCCLCDPRFSVLQGRNGRRPCPCFSVLRERERRMQQVPQCYPPCRAPPSLNLHPSPCPVLPLHAFALCRHGLSCRP